MSTLPVHPTHDHISRDPGICGGKACIAGTRIRVQDVYVWHELQRQTVDEIIARFPQLTHAGVYAALTYFWDNRPALLAEMAAEDKLIESLKRKFPSKIRAKLQGGSDADPVSS